MLSITWMQAKLAAFGAAFLAVMGVILRLKYLEHKTEKLQHRANVLEARHHINKVSKDIQRKEKEKLSLKEKAIDQESKKEPEEFSGHDNLSDPNNF